MSYIVPIHRPSGVRNAIKLKFVSPEEEAVVVAKANRLEIYSYSPEDGLTLLYARTVYGYITMLESIRPQSSPTDHLFVGTDRYQYFTCSWDAETKQLKTEQSYVDQADKTLRDTRESDRVHIDPTKRFMTLELYDGIVTVVPIVQSSTKRVRRDSSAPAPPVPGSLGEPVQVRVEEILIRSSAFLAVDDDEKRNPQLAILWEDNTEAPQLKIRELKYMPGGEQASAELETVAELRADLDLGVSHLIPVSPPYGGFLILAERTISYVDSELRNIHSEPLDENSTVWTCWTKVDDVRWLLADDYGRLFFLMLTIEDGKTIKQWRLDRLGEASKASCLVYLDEGLVFLGSHSGDSQIVRIVEGGVEVVQSFANIAPVLDFELMDLGKAAESTGQTSDFSSGQARIVTASGAWQDGSIRSVRSGVGMEEIGTVGSIPLITDMWAISSSGTGPTQDVLIASFVNETRVFKFDADAAVEELESFHDVELSEPTLHAMNLPDRRLLQIHDTGMKIIDLESGMNIFRWKTSNSEAKITAACANGAHILVVEGGHTVHVFHTSGSDVAPTTSKTFPPTSQISDITVPDSQSNVCLLAFSQSASVAIADLHSLETLHMQQLGIAGGDVPRSVLVANILHNASPTLFIAMADGTVVSYNLDLDKNILSGMSKTLLGTEPVFFKPLPRSSEQGSGLTNIFASCEQPSLIYASEGRIIYSAVNSDKAARVCHFNAEAYPDAIAVATPEELKLAMIDTTRTTQLQTLPIQETVRCLSYQSSAKVFGMGCIRRDFADGEETLKSSIKIADEVGFKELDEYKLADNEMVECIASVQLNEDEQESDEGDCIFVVGTSIAYDESSTTPEDRGRVLVFSVSGKKQKIEIITQQEVRGACRSLAVMDGLVVAGLVKVVVLYRLTPSFERGSRFSHTLTRLASYRTSTDPMSLSIQPRTESNPMIVAVGDLMKSLSLVAVLSPEGSDRSHSWRMEEIGRHYASLWTSSMAALAENEYVIADIEGNLAMLRRNPEAYGEESRRLELTGEMRLGEIINKIVPIQSSKQISLAATAAAASSSQETKGKTRSGSQALDSTHRPSMLGSLSAPVVRPQAFIATVEGAIYMLGAINPLYTDALLRLQAALSTRVTAPGYMPWAKYRAWKTEIREGDEPFRFVDGEMVEQGLLSLSDETLSVILQESGLALSQGEGGAALTLEILRAWGESLRRLY